MKSMKILSACVVVLAISISLSCKFPSNTAGSDDDSTNDSTLFGTYDSWTYNSSTGWLKVPNNQLVLGAASLKMAGLSIFPISNPSYTNQKLHCKDGQIWLEAKVNGISQKVYLYDYYLQDATDYGSPILWIKIDTTSTPTLTAKPDPSTATLNQLLAFVLVGQILTQQPQQAKSVYLAGGVLDMNAVQSVNADTYFKDVKPYYWKDGVPIRLPMPPGADGASAFGTYFAGNKTYVTGFAHGVDDGYWEDGTWHTMPNFEFLGENGIPIFKKLAYFSDTETYIAGYRMNGSEREPGYYKNGVWHALSIPEDSWCDLMSMMVEGQDVYLVGYVQVISSNEMYQACYWKNGEFHLLSANPSEQESFATGIDIQNGDIYVAGMYDTYALRCVGYWKNGVWSRTLLEQDSQHSYTPIDIIETGTNEFFGYLVNAFTLSVTDSSVSARDTSDNAYSGYIQNGHNVVLSSAQGQPMAWSMCNDHEDLYMGGYYAKTVGSRLTSTGGYWKNGVWYPAQSPNETFNDAVVWSVALH